MSDLSRIEKVISAQRNRALIIVIVSLLATGYAIYPSMGFGSWSVIVHLLVSFVCIRVVAFLSVLQLQRKYYKDELHEFVADVGRVEAMKHGEQQPVEEPQNYRPAEIKIIERPEKPHATFKDHPIYEWFVVEMEGETFKIEYDGVLDVVSPENINLKPNEILLPPGILYKKIS